MTTLSNFSKGNVLVPASTSWLLADLGEFRGKQELYTKQSPQRLKALRENAIIESAVSSNRIEGVLIAPDRVREVLIAAKPVFRDRDEEEIRGYREALTLLHADAAKLGISDETIRRLHRLSRGVIWDAGQYKDKDGDIIERYSDGRQRVRFRTVPAAQTPEYMARLVGDWQNCLAEQWVHPLIAMTAFNLDFLFIHPFRDGNGRVSRLLLLLQCYHLGYEVGRYVSLERLIEQNKERYYETLEQSSQGWHKGKEDPWPYINYVLSMLRQAYKDFVERAGNVKAPKGEKTEVVMNALMSMPNEFSIALIEQQCPGVSREMIRYVLANQKGVSLESSSRGPGATWRKMRIKE